MSLRSTVALLGPGGSDPYTYRLAYREKGIPADLSYEARDETLAEVEVRYGSFGAWRRAQKRDDSEGNGAPVAAVIPIADFEAPEAAADLMPAREAEAVLAEGGPTVTMAELPADMFAEHDGEAA